LPDLRRLGLATLCKRSVDQDGANVVFSLKVKLSFYPLVEKIEALVLGVFQYFS